MKHIRNYLTLFFAFLAGTAMLAFAKSGGTQTLSIASGTEPQVTSNQDWCNVAFVNVTQRGTYTYDITAEANTETEDRTATLSVTAGSFSASVQVTQTAGDGLIVAQNSYEMPSAGGPLEVTLTTNGDYSYTINDSWITEAEVNKARAMTEYTLHFTVSANHGAERTGTITFTLNDLSETVSIVQEAGQGGQGVSGETPYEIAASLGLGWNLGNQLDAHNNGVAEEGWGNEPTTQALFDRVAAAGFTSVRIPVTWLGKVGAAPDYTIDADYLNRVAEVVGYAENAGLNAIINIHHDGADSQYWLNIKNAAADETVNEAVKAQLKAMWTRRMGLGRQPYRWW